MTKRNFRVFNTSSSGFSLVELMVALVFTGLLMAGLATVFKSSLSNFYTSGEILSSARRNRASVDLLYDDLNAATLYLNDLTAPPSFISPNNPAFYVLPNQLVAGAGPDDPGFGAAPNMYMADELYLFMDQPLAFEGTLKTPGGSSDQRLQSEDAAGGGTSTSIADTTYTIDCGDPIYARLLQTTVAAAAAQTPPAGLSMVFKDQWKTFHFSSVTPSGPQRVIIAAPGEDTAAITGTGDSGTIGKSHILGSRVMFYSPSQMIRYSIKIKTLDPQNPAGIPCLVKDQGAYSPAGFVADPTQEAIITENVAGFKVYLSTNSGRTWAGLDTATNTPKHYAGFDGGWTNGMRAELDTQLGTGYVGPPAVPPSGRTNTTGGRITTAGDEQWFRTIPTLVRLDITTRTATKRTEYYDPANPTVAAPYRNLTQSLVIVPRHFGLTLQTSSK